MIFIVMQMGFRDFGPRNQYKRLLKSHGDEEKKLGASAPVGRRRRFWAKKLNAGKIVSGLKLSRPGRFNWKGFSFFYFEGKLPKFTAKLLID